MTGREIINKWLAKRGYIIERTLPIVLMEKAQLHVDLDFLIRSKINDKGPAFKFVQIGANDGISRKDDLINYIEEFGISGVLVEPQPDLFKTLCTNMAHYPGLAFVNKAVHRELRFMTLFRLNLQRIPSNTKLPLWARTNGIASFDKNHVLKQVKKISLGEDCIEALEVGCLTLNELLEDAGHIDLLKVDTEGYDYEVLDMLNLEKHCPNLIHFEHRHMKREEFNAIVKKLISAGYVFVTDRNNVTAVNLKH